MIINPQTTKTLETYAPPLNLRNPQDHGTPKLPIPNAAKTLETHILTLNHGFPQNHPTSKQKIYQNSQNLFSQIKRFIFTA